MIPVFIWRKLTLTVALVSLLPVGLAQTASDRIGAITSALRSGEFEKAIQLLQPELQASPRNPKLWMLRGLAYSGKGNNKEALASYQSALKIRLTIFQRSRVQPNWNTMPASLSYSIASACAAAKSQRSHQPRHACGTGL